MSDTPITDKYCFKADGSCDIEVIDTIFVRQMERENAAMRAALEQIRLVWTTQARAHKSDAELAFRMANFAFDAKTAIHNARKEQP